MEVQQQPAQVEAQQQPTQAERTQQRSMIRIMCEFSEETRVKSKAATAELKKGALTMCTPSIEGVKASAQALVQQYKVLDSAAKVEATLVKVPLMGTPQLAPSDEVLSHLLAMQAGQLPTAIVLFECGDSKHHSRKRGLAEANKEGKTSKGTLPVSWLAKYTDRCQTDFDDWWRGMVSILDTKNVQCLFCGGIVAHYPTRPYDLQPVLSHLEAEATKIAKSKSLLALAAGSPDVVASLLPATPDEVPLVLGESVLRERKQWVPPEGTKKLAAQCLAQVWDVNHPFRGGVEPNDYDKNKTPIVLIGNGKKDRATRARILAEAAKLRAARLEKTRHAKELRRKAVEEAKLKQLEEDQQKAADAKAGASMSGQQTAPPKPTPKQKRLPTRDEEPIKRPRTSRAL